MDVLMNNYTLEHDHGGIEKQKAGISSIQKLDSNLVFNALDLKKGDIFLDIGCGAGDYAFRASEFVGDSGFVYAMERWEELVIKLNNKIAEQNINNMQALVGDVTKTLPIVDKSIDVCFISLVLHGIDKKKQAPHLFSEVHRILKPKGCLAVIEMKKEEASESHPEYILFSALEIGNYVAKYGLKQFGYADLGRFYLAKYGVEQ
jgi:ubiquinone/menaquinone biosynthesis C-methylase UbiE